MKMKTNRKKHCTRIINYTVVLNEICEELSVRISDSYSTRTVAGNLRTHMTHGVVEVRDEARAGFHGGGAHFDAGFRVPYQTVNHKDIES